MPIQTSTGINHDIAILHPVLEKDTAEDRGFHKIVVVVTRCAARRHIRFIENTISVNIATVGQIRIIAPGPRKDHVTR